MTRLREDAGLRLPAPPERITPLEESGAGLAIAGPARAAPFHVESDSVSAVGSQLHGVERLWIRSRLVATDVRSDIGPAANVIVRPGLTRRECVGPAGTVIESVAAPPRVPLFVIHWEGIAQGSTSTSLRLHAPGRTCSFRQGPQSVIARAFEGHVVAAGVSPRPEHIELRPDGDETLRLTVRCAAPGPVSLLVSTGTHEVVEAAFRAAEHYPAHMRLVEAPLDEGLIVRTGVLEIDDGVRWARWRQLTARARRELDRSEGSRDGRARSVALPVVGLAPETGAAGLAEAFRTHPDAAWQTWRTALSNGLDSGPAGPGSWDPPSDGSDDPTPRTMQMLHALEAGLLGIETNAGVGRIRIAPRFPSHIERFRVEGIAVGAARLALGYERADRTYTYTLEPTRGGVPPIAVFEPAIRGEVTSVSVDGQPAELDLRHESGRTVVPVQLPIDGVRRIEITTAREG